MHSSGPPGVNLILTERSGGAVCGSERTRSRRPSLIRNFAFLFAANSCNGTSSRPSVAQSTQSGGFRLKISKN